MPTTPTVDVQSAATPAPSPTVEAPEAEDATPQDLSITAEDVQLFPVPRIISGDRVTFGVQPHVPLGVTVENVSVDIYVDGQAASSSKLEWRNWDGRAQGIYEWVWDTSGHPGNHEIRVVLDSQDVIQEGDEDATNNETVFTVRVGKASERPLEERDASWITSENDCCYVHAMTRTAAYRDLPELLATIDSAVSEVASRLNETPENKFDVYLIDRTIGQGGYAGSELVIVYNDRPYIGGALYELIKHEAVHVIDRQFAPQRIEFLAEGVAVWASGGHYSVQDLQRRAAALLAINEYVPLADLADSYYQAQHEIGYLEAGAFVDFLVTQYGWPKVREFYSGTSTSDGATEAEALDTNLQEYFGSSLAELETAWLAQLRSLQPTEAEVADLRSTIRYFETARRYQLAHDATAYFRTAWLPRPGEAIERGNAADFLRRPDSETNLTLEVMLLAAYEAIGVKDYGKANVLLDSIERSLEQDAAAADPLVGSYEEIVHSAVAFGYEPQRVTLDGGNATVLATTASGYQLFDLGMELRRGDWILLSN
jgi:hypothetical protein